MKQFNQRSKARLALTAGIVLAMAFTVSCTADIESAEEILARLSSSSEGNSSPSSSSVTCPAASGNVFIDPRDCKAYKFEVAPDGTVWMSENLNYSRDNTLGYCYEVDINGANPHQDAPGCGNGYGRAYEWAVAIDGNSPQGLCPDGWHIPSVAEWNTVIDDYYEPIMSIDFYIYPGNYNVNSEYPPFGWKERDESGFYWTSNNADYFTGFWNGPASVHYYSNSYMLEAKDGASALTERFSVRCIKNERVSPSSSSVTLSSSSVEPSSSSSSPSSSSALYGSVYYEGQTYKTVVIGTQTWMAENLNYAVDGSKCYNNEQSNCDTYGRLYDWATAMALPSSCNSTICSSQIGSPHRGICPSGWHIPNDDDWDVLMNYVGGSYTAGTKLKSQTGWNSSSGVPAGTDAYGFSALPGGYGASDGSFGSFGSVGRLGYWWSTSEDGSYYTYNLDMNYNGEYAGWANNNKAYLFSVRCLQD